jgi:hypothetical protein
LKAQAPKVSNDQVIAQAIKALCVGPLRNHLVREWPKTTIELYENFTKFSKLEALHFRKLEQQREAPKHDEASRPTHYNDNNQCSYPKQVHSIDSNGYKPPGKWEKNFGCPRKKGARGASTIDQTSTTREEACQAAVTAEAHSSLCTACTTTTTPTIAQETTQYSFNPRERWSKTLASVCNNPHPAQ